MKKISIVILDDHTLIREMWGQLFASNNEMEITGESGLLAEAIEIIRKQQPDIVFLDINLGEESGISAIPIIRKISPDSKVIVISMHDELSYARKMLSLGATGYITKSSKYAEVIKAIGIVLTGNTYICDDIKNTLSDELLVNASVEAADVKKLSQREIDVARFIRNGLTSKEISVNLAISPGTVDVHRHNILKKLNIKNTATLIYYLNNTDVNLI